MESEKMKAKKVKGKDSKRWQKAIIGILLALIMMASVVSLLTHLTFGSDVTQTTVRNGYIVNPDNVTISMDGNITSVLIGQNVQFMCDGNKTGIVTVMGIKDTSTEGYVFITSNTGWLDTSVMTEAGLYNATYGDYWELLAVSMPIMDLRLKIGTKEVSSICRGTPLGIDFTSNLDENDCIDLKIVDPDGSVIKVFNNQKFEDINVSQLLEYGSGNETKRINTTGWKIGTYTFSVRTEEENARGLDLSSNTRTLALIVCSIGISAEKINIVKLEKVRIIVTGVANYNITISSSDPVHTIFPAGYEDNPSYDSSGFNDTIDADGIRTYVVYFNNTGTYTITVTDTTAGLDDTVDITVSEKAVIFDVPPTVVIGEKFTIKGTANTGTTVDIAVEDYVHPQLNDLLIDENGEFEKEIDTATANITPFTVPGSVRLKAYIDRTAGAGAIGPTETDDGSVAILMLEAHLNVTLSKAIIPLGESFEVYGNASSVYVEIVAISPKGGNGIGMDGLYGVSIYTVPTFNPYMSGSSFYKLETGSDDIIIVTPFPIEPAYIKLDPIKDVAIGDGLVVTGTTNHIDGSPIVITVKGSMELPPQTAYVENGTFKAVFDTSYALPGVYTVKADDGDGHTDETTVNILSVMRNFYKKIKVDTGADTGNYAILVLSPGIDGVYGNSSYKYIDTVLDLDGAGPELGAIDVSNQAQDEIVAIIEDATSNQAGSDDLLQELYLYLAVLPPGPPNIVTVSEPIEINATPASIPADGISTSTITIAVFWPKIEDYPELGEIEGYENVSGMPACLTRVDVGTTLGKLTEATNVSNTGKEITVYTNENGTANVLLLGNEVGLANITARATAIESMVNMILGNETTVYVVRNSTTVTFLAIPFFDIGPSSNPYPSISGTHNGTIKPNQPITVSELYTYPCAGTGGHTEYVWIYGHEVNVSASWNGYVGDWHNISFPYSFTLETEKTYNYTIRTGSYPQIIHTSSKPVAGGTITCTKFTDANGRVYYDWIPAIRLWAE